LAVSSFVETDRSLATGVVSTIRPVTLIFGAALPSGATWEIASFNDVACASFGKAILADQESAEQRVEALACCALEGKAAPSINWKAAVTVSPLWQVPKTATGLELKIEFSLTKTVAFEVFTTSAKLSDGADRVPAESTS
jgi:hypothetical protein